jgi:hypothetical protein
VTGLAAEGPARPPRAPCCGGHHGGGPAGCAAPPLFASSLRPAGSGGLLDPFDLSPLLAARASSPSDARGIAESVGGYGVGVMGELPAGLERQGHTEHTQES